MVKRLTMSSHPLDGAAMDAHPHGDYVLYSDFAELEAENERLRTLVMAQSRAIHSPEALSRTGAVKVPAEASKEMIEDGVLAYNLTGIAGGFINTAEDHVTFIWNAMAAHLSALEPAAPEGQQDAVAWATVRVEDTCDGLLIHPDDAKEWDLVADHPYEGTFLPDGRYRIALTRPTEQAVTEAMVEAAARAMCAPFPPDETIYLGGYYKRWETHMESAALALKAAMEAGR